MSNVNAILDMINKEQIGTELPDFRVGDTIRVHVKIREGEKERVQVFEGACIGFHHGSAGGSFTVRKVSYGVGVERVFPLKAPRVEKVEIKQRGVVRRAKLYYLRERRGRAARIKARTFTKSKKKKQ
jgi:large subunit ribosomal protein L19